MKKSTRALLGMVVLDGLVFLGAAWMILQTRSGAWRTPDPDSAVTMITTTGGAVIGIVTVILAIAFTHHRRHNN